MTRKRGELHPDDDGLDGLGEVPAKSLAEWRERVARSTRQDDAAPVTVRAFTILGTPVTKKNSFRILRSRTGRPFVMPSAAYKAWENTAVLQLQSQNRGAPAITTRVELTAIVYRKRATGDLDNHLSAVCDALQEAQVIKNDKLVASFGKSRLDKDAARPRVEITITEAGATVLMGEAT